MKVYKKALVTGGAQRIGASMVEFLANNGIDVAIQYNRSEKEINNIVEEVKDDNYRFRTVIEQIVLSPSFYKKEESWFNKLVGG